MPDNPDAMKQYNALQNSVRDTLERYLADLGAGRHGIKGGETRVLTRDSQRGQRFTLTGPG